MSSCAYCNKKFGILRWRHSCPACANTVCNKCLDFPIQFENPNEFQAPASSQSIGSNWNKKSHKCCQTCFQRIDRIRSARSAASGSGSSTSLTSKSGKSGSITSKFNQEYTVGKQIGTGGTATVYLATNNRTHQSFAVKIFKRKELSNGDIQQLHEEVRILRSLDHPNIVKVFNFYEESLHYYLVMEAISGGELFDRIVKKSTYSEKEARDFAKVLLGAIKYMHDRNIVHR